MNIERIERNIHVRGILLGILFVMGVAESAVDFAPLQVGNTWEYYRTYWQSNASSYSGETPLQIGTRDVLLVTKTISHDTNYYQISIKDSI